VPTRPAAVLAAAAALPMTAAAHAQLSPLAQERSVSATLSIIDPAGDPVFLFEELEADAFGLWNESLLFDDAVHDSAGTANAVLDSFIGVDRITADAFAAIDTSPAAPGEVSAEGLVRFVAAFSVASPTEIYFDAVVSDGPNNAFVQLFGPASFDTIEIHAAGEDQQATFVGLLPTGSYQINALAQTEGPADARDPASESASFQITLIVPAPPALALPLCALLAATRRRR